MGIVRVELMKSFTTLLMTCLCEASRSGFLSGPKIDSEYVSVEFWQFLVIPRLSAVDFLLQNLR